MGHLECEIETDSFDHISWVSFPVTVPSVLGLFSPACLLHILRQECAMDQLSVTRIPFVVTCNTVCYFNTSLGVSYVCWFFIFIFGY